MNATATKRILVIDDELVVRRLLESVLGFEYEVVTLPSGEDLRPLFESIDPDLVILDIRMPLVNGYEIARRIRSWPSGADVPLMFLSGHYQDIPAIHAMESTGAYLMTKPFDVRHLRRRIAMMLRHENASRSDQ